MKLMGTFLFFIFLNEISFAENSRWDHSLTLSITRCFKTEGLSVRCEEFSDNKKKPRQDLQIEAIDYNGIKRSYGYGRAIEGLLCQKHLKVIKDLVRNRSQACITGDDEVDIEKKETYSRWRGFETKTGRLDW
jgi:hypothetical protein